MRDQTIYYKLAIKINRRCFQRSGEYFVPIKNFNRIVIINADKITGGVEHLSPPTRKLLSSSVLVAISGSLRLIIAFLFAGITPEIPICIAGGMIIYATYTLDRSLDCREDAINRSELQGADIRIGLCACAFTFLIAAYLFAVEKILFAAIYPFIVGFLYTRGLKFGRVRIKLKGGAGGKNIIIGLTWGGTIALILMKWTTDAGTLLTIFVFYLVKLLMNSAIFDLKDIKGDLAAGIQTLPVLLGEGRTRMLLLVLCLTLHLFMILSISQEWIRPEFTICGYSFFTGILCILLFSRMGQKQADPFTGRMREILIDCESSIALILRTVLLPQF
jgi:4-hydroxybenzoate polyprenyltransferase